MAARQHMRAILAAAALLLAPVPAPAEPAGAPGRDLHLRYEVYWGGLHAADFVLSSRRDGGHYDHTFRLRTRGMFNWILGLEVAARGTGRAPASLPLQPRTYDVDFVNRWRSGDITMLFDPESGAIDSVYRADPPRHDDDDDDEEVTAEARRGALDPLAAFLEAVRRAGEDGAAGERRFRLKVFDGRRRFDATGEVLGMVHRDILGTGRDARHLRITTLPVAGFNDRQLEMWDGKSYDVYLSTDGRLVPLKIKAEGMGPHINLIAECEAAAACALPGEKATEQSINTRGARPPG